MNRRRHFPRSKAAAALGSGLAAAGVSLIGLIGLIGMGGCQSEPPPAAPTPALSVESVAPVAPTPPSGAVHGADAPPAGALPRATGAMPDDAVHAPIARSGQGARPPGHPTTLPPGHPTTLPPGHPTTLPPGHPTTLPPGHPTTLPPGHPTTLPPGHPTTLPPGHPTTLPPGHPAIPGDDELATMHGGRSGDSGSGGDARKAETEGMLPLVFEGPGGLAELERRSALVADEEARARLVQAFRLVFTVRRELRDYPGAGLLARPLAASDDAMTAALAERVLGYVAVNSGFDMPAAIAHYRRAIELAPDYGDAHYALAFMYAMNEPQLGRTHFERAIALGVRDTLGLAGQFPGAKAAPPRPPSDRASD